MSRWAEAAARQNTPWFTGSVTSISRKLVGSAYASSRDCSRFEAIADASQVSLGVSNKSLVTSPTS